MCILCVIQKWSRRVATLLPWLVIPLIGFWALSQLLPPAFRFEITSPKLACVFVLLVTLFWYEVLMPQLSAWRERRNAQLREKKRFEAIELEKLRKTATRRCRNCLTPYKEQNPGGGKFMCSYCGHVSKRPVLDLPVPPSLEGSNLAIMKDLVGKGGKMLNGKAWSENGWVCSQDWLDNGNWMNGSVSVTSSYWRKNGFGLFGRDENCFAEKSYPGVFVFACKLLTSFFLSIRWIWRKVFRVSLSKEVNSPDAEHRGLMAKEGENGANCHESRGEKARRKAEEKRLARLEKELEEEEERKQREEVARLVEERRKLRDEKIEAEKDRNKSLPPARENKKELEKKRQERKKDKDKWSSKSSSDAEELDRKAGKESERKRDNEKKSESEHREHQKSGTENAKGQNELGNGPKNVSSSNFSRGNAGTRYLDRMRGTFLSSSRAFTGSGFFGRTASSTAISSKDNKLSIPIDQSHTSAGRRDTFPPEQVAGNFNLNGDDKNFSRTVPLEPQPRVAQKKTWQQLFTRSAATPPPSSNVISRPNSKLQADGPSQNFPGQSSAVPFFDNPISFGLPSPFISPYPNVSASSSLGFSPLIEPKFPHVIDGHRETIPEEQELYEDPIHNFDPRSLLGPVSESLDNFQLDLGTGHSSDLRFDEPCHLNNRSASPEVNKPSPIESPISRIRIGDERHNSCSWFPTTPVAPDMNTLPVQDAHVNEKGTWQMWNSSPLGHDGLGLVGVTGDWLLPQERNKSSKEDTVQSSSQKTMASLFPRDNQVLSGTQTPSKVFVSNGQNGGAFSPAAGSSMNEPWLQKAFYPPLTGSESSFPLKAQEETSQNVMTYRSPFEPSPVNSWSKKEHTLQGSGEGVGRSSVQRPNSEVQFPLQMYSHFGQFINK